jgi:hypothetical protein
VIVLRIVPPETGGDGPCPCNGTRVLMPDGSAVPNVLSIRIQAEPNDIWRAWIECHVRLEPVTVEVDSCHADAGSDARS